MEKKNNEYLPRYENPLEYMKKKNLDTEEEIPLKSDIEKLKDEMER